MLDLQNCDCWKALLIWLTENIYLRNVLILMCGGGDSCHEGKPDSPGFANVVNMTISAGKAIVNKIFIILPTKSWVGGFHEQCFVPSIFYIVNRLACIGDSSKTRFSSSNIVLGFAWGSMLFTLFKCRLLSNVQQRSERCCIFVECHHSFL